MKRHYRKNLLAALLLAALAAPASAEGLTADQEQAFRAELMRDLRVNVEALYRNSQEAARAAAVRTFAVAGPDKREKPGIADRARGRDHRRAVKDEYAL
jgi:hypothetical protein